MLLSASTPFSIGEVEERCVWRVRLRPRTIISDNDLMSFSLGGRPSSRRFDSLPSFATFPPLKRATLL